MVNYYLAVDIGASSGRHILSHMEQGKIVLEEIYRFPNGMIKKDGHLVWDIRRLFAEILTGMKKCRECGKIPVSMGIDTWAVDFALLDEQGELLTEVYGYRDVRTHGMDEKVYERITEEELYARTGIQKQLFNTIYQLMAAECDQPGILERADAMLMIPDYFHYLLTGRKVTEYTNATTTQLVDPDTYDWDRELIEKLGFSKKIFKEIIEPGTEIGLLLQEIQKEVGFQCKVVVPATHDTASAVMAVPIRERTENAAEGQLNDAALYISSGTWSLLGTELKQANRSPAGKLLNLTNEGGYEHRFRYLKNIMGLWMINSAKQEIGGEYSFSQICEMACREDISSLVDVNEDRFLAPENMTEEIRQACKETGQQIPEGIAQVAAVIYHSLAAYYAKAVKEIEQLTGQQFASIHIVGGGSDAVYLNKLTAEACKKTVYAGPTEATAIGNVVAQMISARELKNLREARKCISESFEIRRFEKEKKYDEL